MPPEEQDVDQLNEELANQVTESLNKGDPVDESADLASPEGIELELPPEGDDDDEVDQPDAKPSRREKKRQRLEAIKEEARQEAVREAEERFERRLAEERQQMQQMLRQPQQQPADDPIDRAYDQLRQDTKRLTEWYAGLQNPTAEQVKEFEDRAWELRRRETEIGAASYQRRNQPDPRVQQQQALLQRVQAEHPDIFQNPRARDILEHAGAYVQAEMKLKGRQYSWDLTQEAIQDAKQRFGLAKTPPPSEATKRRHTSQPRREGASAASGPRTVKLSKEDVKMALAMHQPSIERGDMTEKQALQTYYKEILEPQSRQGA